MVALHSGISLESSLTAADQARLTLDQMEKINMEPDLLTKLENGNGNTQIWLNYKSMTMERLNDKLMRVNKRITDFFFQQGLKSKGIGNHWNKKSRSIDFIGNVISYISGIPSPGEWRLNLQNVVELRKAMTLLNRKGDLEGHQIDLNSHSIGKLHTVLTILVDKLNDTTNKINIMEEGLNSRLIFSTMEQGVTHLIETMESVVLTIENILE